MLSKQAILAVFATFWTVPFSEAVPHMHERHSRNNVGRNAFNPFILIPEATANSQATPSPSTNAVGGTNTMSGLVVGMSPQSSSDAAQVVASSAETLSLSLTETVILIPPIGTIGGSIIITSVPISATAPLSFIAPGPSILPASRVASGEMGSQNGMPTAAASSFGSATTGVPTGAMSSQARSASISDQPGQSQTMNFQSVSSLVMTTSTPSDSILSITTPSSTFSTSTWSSLSSSSTSSSSRSSSTQSSSTISMAKQTSDAQASDQPKRTDLSGGAIAGIAVSLFAFAGIFGAIAYFCLRRRRPKAPSVHVYPEEAYLYDPPITPPGTVIGPNNRGMSQITPGLQAQNSYDAVTSTNNAPSYPSGSGLVGPAAAAAYIRPITPEPPINESDGLLSSRSSQYSVSSRSYNNSRPVSGSIPAIAALASASTAGGAGHRRQSSRSGYSLAPVGERDSESDSDGGGNGPVNRRTSMSSAPLTNPFADPPNVRQQRRYTNDTAYNAGQYAVRHEPSAQTSPAKKGQRVSPQMMAVRDAWGWER